MIDRMFDMIEELLGDFVWTSSAIECLTCKPCKTTLRSAIHALLTEDMDFDSREGYWAMGVRPLRITTNYLAKRYTDSRG